MGESRRPMGEEVHDLLGRLVAFPTESRTSNIELIDFVASRVAGAGAAVRVVDGAPGRANLLVRFGPEAPGGVLLSGHTDVVPAGAGWDSDPYVLTPSGGRLVGRGTADMKGFIACAIAVGMARDTSRWSVPLHIGLSYDEEIGCAGVRSLLDVLSADAFVEPEIVVVGEPTGLALHTAHVGKVAYTVRATCPPGHSKLAPTRTNAIDEIVSIAGAISGIETSAHGAHGGTSTNVGTIHGGVAVNVLAPTCDLTFECRHPDGVRPDDVLAPAWAQVDRSRAALTDLGGSLDVTRDAMYPALDTDASHPAVLRLATVLGREPAGRVDFGSEAGCYSQTLGVPSVVYGPGDITVAHRPNESIESDELAATCRSLDALIDAYCVGATTARTG